MTIKKRYKLLLINPGNAYKKGIYHDKVYSVPPLGLRTLAALTPDNWDIEIFDENFEEFTFKKADLVGITALTSQVTSAYKIAEVYKENNIPTILGGIHASMMPDEAMNYVDVVLNGEAEGIWEELISDFENGKLKSYYKAELVSMSKSPPPRIDLFHPDYALGSLQTTRGCPNNCEFCTVHVINGHKCRFKSIEQAVKEFIDIPQDRVYIVDDDFYGYTKESAKRAIDFCKGVIKSGVKKDWYTFTSMHLAKDEDALKYMSEAGCRMVLLGIESELVSQLAASHKRVNLKVGVDNYEKVYDAFHRNGIAVLGSFIFGLDSDTPESIMNRVDYYINSGVDCIQAGMLTPLPGSGTFFRLKRENRIIHNNFPEDWDKYTFFNNIIKPINMSPDEFVEVMNTAWEKIYDLKIMKRKYLQTLKATKNPISAGWAFSTNINYRNTIFEGQKENLNFTKNYYKLTSVKVEY